MAVKVTRSGTVTYEDGGVSLVVQLDNDTIREVQILVSGAGREPDSLKLRGAEAQKVQALLGSVFPLPPETDDGSVDPEG